MAELNHSIVWCRDKATSAAFLADILDRPPPKLFRHECVGLIGGLRGGR